ncbi:MAG: hypothetical protein EOP22_12170 [Hyphomicrobiales bacterium]|nr:MAG: hypothetical protein EOP22_12170 [Hyphomicrobiales bacterium]
MSAGRAELLRHALVRAALVAAPPALLVLVMSLVLPAGPASLEVFVQAIGLPGLLFASIGEMFGLSFAPVREFLSGDPALAIVLAIAFYVELVILLRLPLFGRPIIDLIWRPAPELINYRPSQSDGFFAGRLEEMSTLMRAAADLSRPRIYQVTAREGGGKSRFAAEVLSRLEKAGWDAGFLAPGSTPEAARSASFRKRSLVVIDEAASTNMLWAILLELIAKKRPILILLLERFPLSPDASLDVEKARRIREAMWPAIKLPPLTEAQLRLANPQASAAAIAGAEGLPLYAMLGDAPHEELKRRAAKRLDRVVSEEDLRTLLLTSLVGPFPIERLVETPRTVHRLGRLGELLDVTREALQGTVPGLKPDFIADEVALLSAADLPRPELDELLAVAAGINAVACTRRVMRLRRRAASDSNLRDLAMHIEDVVLTRAPEGLTAIVHSAAEAAAAYAKTGDDATLDQLYDILQEAPFHPDLQRIAIMTLTSMCRRGAPVVSSKWEGVLDDSLSADTNRYSTTQRREVLPELGYLHHWLGELNLKQRATRAIELYRRLNDGLVDIHDDPVGRWVARIACQVTHISDSCTAAEIEPWLAETLGYEGSRPSSSALVQIAAHAVTAYARLGDEAELEKWTAIFDRWVALERKNPQLRAFAVIKAIEYHGKLDRVDDAGRWLARLPPITDAAINAEENSLEGCWNTTFALDRYVKAFRGREHFDVVLPLASQLAEVATPRFGSNRKYIRSYMALAGTMFDAAIDLGDGAVAERWLNELERWWDTAGADYLASVKQRRAVYQAADRPGAPTMH